MADRAPARSLGGGGGGTSSRLWSIIAWQGWQPEDYSTGKPQDTDAMLQPKIATDGDDGGDVDDDEDDDDEG